MLFCMGLGKDRSDPNRMRYDEGLYFKSAPEIAEASPAAATRSWDPGEADGVTGGTGRFRDFHTTETTEVAMPFAAA